MIKSISTLETIKEGKEVIVNEGGEKLISINNESPESLVVFSKAFKDGKKGSIETVYVRESLKGLLLNVADNLPKGYKLVVWEAYTPKTLHEALRNKKLNQEEMNTISHMTGGAVDVSLADENGNLLEMGTDLNHGAPQNKSTLYFEELIEKGVQLTDEHKEIAKNRRILFHAMNDVGFINNPLAWFHWDYGNKWWSEATGENAFYDAIDH